MPAPKLKNDVTIIHYKDGEEVKCSYNTCRDKFVEVERERTFKSWDNASTFESTQFFWQCRECNAKYKDNKQSKKSAKKYQENLHKDVMKG